MRTVPGSGLDGGRGREAPAQELLPHQAACHARGLVSDIRFGGRASCVNTVVMMVMVITFSCFVTIEQDHQAGIDLGSPSL